MRCALCRVWFSDNSSSCPGCRPRNHELLHQEFRSVEYVLKEIPAWTGQGLIAGHEATTLKIRCRTLSS